LNRNRQEDVRGLIQAVFRAEHKEGALLLQSLRQHWPQVVGAELAERCWPDRLHKETLWIAATDSCWAYELQFHKRLLLGSVRTFLENTAVRDLRFSADPVNAAEMRPCPAASPAPPSAGDLVSEGELERVASGIGNPELRHTFLKAMRRIRAKNPPTGSL